MNSRFLLLYILFSFLPFVMEAQQEKKIEASYTYLVPENTTVEQAKLTALDRAKTQAIADEYGTIVSQSNTTFVKNSNAESSIDFMSLSSSDVKGEWIETIGEPKFEITYIQGQLVVTVSVIGRIREIVSSKIDLITQVLCNGITPQFERTEFRNGDDLYFRFQSPVDGFLAVYLVDAITKVAYCLLPYKQSGDMTQQIKRDRPYLFFSQQNVSVEMRNVVDEYSLTCGSGSERNDLYIIFSPHQFAKANGISTADLLPRELTWSDFNAWIAKTRKRDTDMNVVIKAITINP